MKIGILTFFRGVNYGAQLQAYALSRVLMNMGFEVVFIDRRDCAYAALWAACHWGVRRGIRCLARSMLGGGDAAAQRRIGKSFNFVSRYLKVTPYSFEHWRDAPSNLDVDLLVVGSDQVWNGIWFDPSDYLLEGAPLIPAISYAASFGMREIPQNLRDMYVKGFSKFIRIGVREQEGVELVSQCGYTATHVVDPTILLEREHWSELLTRKKSRARKTIVIYMISAINLNELLDMAEGSLLSDLDVKVFSGNVVRRDVRSPFKIIGNYLTSLRLKAAHVQFCLDAGADEFVNAIAQADAVISDSFHALMFASVFNRNVRIIRNNGTSRKDMFARLREFADKYIEGEVFVETIKDGFLSLKLSRPICYRSELLREFRNQSKKWLSDSFNFSLCNNEGVSCK